MWAMCKLPFLQCALFFDFNGFNQFLLFSLICIVLCDLPKPFWVTKVINCALRVILFSARCVGVCSNCTFEFVPEACVIDKSHCAAQKACSNKKRSLNCLITSVLGISFGLGCICYQHLTIDIFDKIIFPQRDAQTSCKNGIA